MTPQRLAGPGAAALLAALVAVALVGDSLVVGGISPSTSSAPDATAAPVAAAPSPDLGAAASPSSAPASSPAAPAGPTSSGSPPAAEGGDVRSVIGDPQDCNPPASGTKPAPVVRSFAADAKVVALTFDDGWNADDVAALFEILERERVNATFFPTGWAVATNPKLWRQITAAGFPLGNHTMNHPDLTTLCFARQVHQLHRAEVTIRRVLGVEPLPVMRPPYGEIDRTVRLAASAAGMVAVVKWSVESYDWSGIPGKRLAELALDGRPGSIVVLHTLHNTVKALPAIIAGYRARGFTFVTVGQLLGIDGPVPFE